MRKKLDEAAIAQRMEALPEWKLAAGDSAITRTFKFADFNAAFGFMTRVALVAEQLDHHPDWTNVYNRVDVVLSTHDADGLTESDFKLAAAMDKFAAD